MTKVDERIEKCKKDYECEKKYTKYRINSEIFKLFVKTADLTADNNQQIYLADPEHPEQYLVLTYPKAVFKQNNIVILEPSPQKSGWLLKNEQGAALTFVPAPGNEANNYSYLF